MPRVAALAWSISHSARSSGGVANAEDAPARVANANIAAAFLSFIVVS
jgi:hypothetical protein